MTSLVGLIRDFFSCFYIGINVCCHLWPICHQSYFVVDTIYHQCPMGSSFVRSSPITICISNCWKVFYEVNVSSCFNNFWLSQHTFKKLTFIMGCKRYKFVCLSGIYVPQENFSLIWRRHYYRWRASNFYLY